MSKKVLILGTSSDIGEIIRSVSIEKSIFCESLNVPNLIIG